MLVSSCLGLLTDTCKDEVLLLSLVTERQTQSSCFVKPRRFRGHVMSPLCAGSDSASPQQQWPSTCIRAPNPSLPRGARVGCLCREGSKQGPRRARRRRPLESGPCCAWSGKANVPTQDTRSKTISQTILDITENPKCVLPLVRCGGCGAPLLCWRLCSAFRFPVAGLRNPDSVALGKYEHI